VLQCYCAFLPRFSKVSSAVNLHGTFSDFESLRGFTAVRQHKLECVVVCRSVMQCVAVYCSVLQCVAAELERNQSAAQLILKRHVRDMYVAVFFNVLQVSCSGIRVHLILKCHIRGMCVVAYCSVLQRVAACYSVLQRK